MSILKQGGQENENDYWANWGASGYDLTKKLQQYGYSVALVAGKNGELGTDVADFVLTTDLRNVATIKSFFQDLNVNHLILGTGHRFAFQAAQELEKIGIISNVNISASLRAKIKNDYKDLVKKKDSFLQHIIRYLPKRIYLMQVLLRRE